MGIEPSRSCVICGRDGLDPAKAVALSNGLRHEECPGLGEGDHWPFERHEMPNGAEVFYRDADHSYYTEIKPVERGRGAKKRVVAHTGVRGKQIPSPSSIAKFADPEPDGLMNWSASREREGFCMLIGELLDEAELLFGYELRADELRRLTDPEKVYEELKQRELTWRHLRDAKGDIGSTAHRAFEELLAGAVPEELAGIAPEDEGYVRGVINFLNDLGEWELLQRECVVYSKKYGFAGRFDARIRVPVRDHSGVVTGHETWLLDLKTSGFIGLSYHEQMRGYDLAAEECGIGASDKLIIVQVTEEGSYTPWPARSSRRAFLNSLDKHRDKKMGEAQIRRDYKELAA